MINNFCVIVLCHARPDDTTTPETLRKFGYTGKIILLLDDEDTTIDQYRNNFKDYTIETYSKDDKMKIIDSMDNTGDKRCAVYARNACFDVANKYGYRYFCQMDDDYTSIPYRFIENDKLYRSDEVNLDEVFKAYIDFMNVNDNIYSVAFAEPGDFTGGTGSKLNQRNFLTKCMGSWICDVNKPLTFKGTMNDDVNTYALAGAQGKMFFTFNFIMIDTPATQSVKGGMTDIYLSIGTYCKTFYTVLCCPSFVKVDVYDGHGKQGYRIHHRFKWDNAKPKLISSRWKK